MLHQRHSIQNSLKMVLFSLVTAHTVYGADTPHSLSSSASFDSMSSSDSESKCNTNYHNTQEEIPHVLTPFFRKLYFGKEDWTPRVYSITNDIILCALYCANIADYFGTDQCPCAHFNHAVLNPKELLSRTLQDHIKKQEHYTSIHRMITSLGKDVARDKEAYHTMQQWIKPTSKTSLPQVDQIIPEKTRLADIVKAYCKHCILGCEKNNCLQVTSASLCMLGLYSSNIDPIQYYSTRLAQQKLLNQLQKSYISALKSIYDLGSFTRPTLSTKKIHAYIIDMTKQNLEERILWQKISSKDSTS